MKKAFSLSSLVLACTLAFSSCSKSGLVEVPSYIDTSVTVSLDQEELSLAIGSSTRIEAAVSDEEASVVWLNEDPTVIDLVKDGTSATITAKSVGTSYVTVIAGADSASCLVTVGGSYTPITVTSLTLDKTSIVKNVGEVENITATVEAKGGTPIISWASGNEKVVTVSKQSNNVVTVTAVGKGSAMVTAACGGKTAQCEVVVDDPNETLSIRLNTSGLSIKEGATSKLNATTKPANAVITWQSNDPAIASVDNDGNVTGNKVGKAVISATISDGDNTQSATCNVTVTSADSSDKGYDEQIKAWSEPGHLYLHYLRNTDANYDKWALWIWPNYPHDGEGSLWGANTKFDLKGVTPQTIGYMTNAQCGGTGTDPYIDDYGRVIDVDLTLQDLPGGKTGKNSPLVSDELWDSELFQKAALGFLIVDQSKMTGEDMWVSDGGAESYIKKLGKIYTEGKNSYAHVYCVEGNVADFTTSSGKQEFVNPTATDTEKLYRSKNDITNLKEDAYPNGVATSTSFLEEGKQPGVGYQIFVPSFSDSDGDGYGDIKGITEKLDYLDDLGVKVLWLTPIQESNSYHGYDVTDYYKIDQRFGTLQDYQELIYKAHKRGMKVLMDMVINHTSKSNVLFKKSQRAETEIVNGKEINYRDMYLWKYEGDKILEWNGVEGKYTVDNPATFITKNVEDSDDWYRDGTSNYFYYGKFGSGMAELNYSSKATREYMTDMCKYWLSFGLDGFRLDAIKHIYLLAELDPTYSYNGDYITYDVSYRTYYNEEMGTTVRVQNDYTYDRDLNVNFWKQFSGSLKSAYPNCFLVGENFDGWDARIAPFYESMDSQFDFSTYYHLNEVKPESIGSSINHSLSGGNGDKGYYDYSANRINGAFTSNHDIARMMNHAAAHGQSVEEKYAGRDAIHSVEINSSNLQYAKNTARYYSAISILTPGVSWIYYGDELGMTGNMKDVVKDSTGQVVDDHGNNVDRWYRQPMKWGNTLGEDNVVKYGFSGLEVLWDNINKDVKTASEQKTDENSMLSYFKLLTAVKNDPRYPTYGWVKSNGSINGDPSGSYMEITDGVHIVRVRINNGDSDVTLQMPDSGTFLGGSKGADNGKIPAHGFHVILG